MQLLLVLPQCGGSSVSRPPGDAGSAGQIVSGGTSNAGGSSSGFGGKAGRAGSGNAGRAGDDGGSSGESSAGETSGGESSGGRAAAGGQPAEGGDNAGGASGDGAGTPSIEAGSSGTGGAGTGGGGTGGVPPAPRPDFLLGADISGVQEAIDLGAVFVDTDGVQKSMVEVLAAHGFNAIRLRTFVEPANLYGYANPNGDPAYVRAEPYCDRDHTVEFGKQMKDAGMSLLVDLHYSDNWADPGKQFIPEDWRDVQTIEELGAEVRAYTQDLIQTMVDQGARPDIVQLGNEIAPGMLIHVPGETPNADQWGNMEDMDVNPINGSSSNWASLGLLLREGAAAVRAVDPSIRVMLHLANTTSPNAITAWINSARAEGVEFDILGLSCYTNWHGPPSFWHNTFQTLAGRFTDLDFVIAEYGPEARRANEIVRDIPDQRGLGTFVWEPTDTGVWGEAMFARSGNTYTARSDVFAIYDGIRADFGLP